MANREISNDFSASVSCDSDFVTEMFCESCQKDSKYSKAEGFCVDCVEYFCAKCMKFHERFLPHHVHQDQLTMPQDFCLETCEIHSTEIIKFFCKACSSFACSKCKSNLHQNCRTAHVPEIVGNIEKSTNFHLFKSKLDHCEKELKNVTESLIQTKHSEVEKCCIHAKSAIKAQREEMNKKFDVLEMNIERRIDKIRTDDAKQLDDLTDKYDEQKSKCESLRRNVEVMQTTEQRSKLFITMQNSKKVVEQFEKSIAEIENCSKVQNYVYNPNRYLQAVIEDCDEIGSVTDLEFEKSVKIHRSGEVCKRRKNDLFKSALQSCGNDISASFQDDINAWRTETINIAVIGVSGAGKSRFINSMCEFDAEDTSAAKVSETETGIGVTPFSLRRNRNVILWDFPGVGTAMFPKSRYLYLIDFKKYDFFIIVVRERFTETDFWLMREIERRDKTLYVLRSHFDSELASALLMRAKIRSNEDDVEDDIKSLKSQMMSCYKKQLKDFKSKDKIFIIAGFKLDRYDYERFEKALIADAAQISESKAHAIIFALPIITEYAKDTKYVQLQKRLSRKALHAACSLPSDVAVARSLVEEKQLYISQLSPPYETQFDLDSDLSKVKGELLDLEERLYHKQVHSAVDELFEQSDKTIQFLLPRFDIVQLYTICRVWLKNNFASLLPRFQPK